MFIDKTLSYDFMGIDTSKGEVTEIMKKSRAKMLQVCISLSYGSHYLE